MATLAETPRRLKLSPSRGLPRLILMTDTERLADPTAVVRSLPRGSAVILRHYEDIHRAALAARLSAICRRRGLLLLIADDARLAIKVGADGLHLPGFRLRRGPHRWRLWRKPDWIVTAAVHSQRDLIHARHVHATAVLISPIFSTSSHPNVKPLGPLRFSTMLSSALPTYALGGVSALTAKRLSPFRVTGFAAISALSP